MDSISKYPNSKLAKDTQITMLKVIKSMGFRMVCGSWKKV